MKKSILLLLSLIALISNAQIMTYRQLPELQLSNVFEVSIRQGNSSFQTAITYGIPNSESGMVTKVEHMSMFAFEPESGPLDICVKSKTGTVLSEENIELVNKMYQGVQVTFADNNMYLRVNQPKKQLFVRLKSDKGNPLLLAVDPVKESEIPPTAKVVRFAANSTPYVQTAQYDRYTVANDVDVVYIEDGALIKGTIHTASGRSKPLKLMGRGMVIGNGGILNGPTNIPYNAVVITSGSGNSIEGITVMKSRHFSMDIGNNGLIDNVKLFGYNFNNDGIVAGQNSRIENSFLKVNDDHIKLYNNNITVKNCVFYVQTNGGILQFAWNSVNPGDNCLVENCEVVACEYTYCGDPTLGQGGLARCFVSLREEESEGKALLNTTIRNVLIQGQLIRFMGINGYDYKGIDVSGLVLENIHVVNTPSDYSWVYTKSPAVPPTYKINIVLKNVVFGNRAVALSDFKTLGDVTLNFDNAVIPFIGKFTEPYNLPNAVSEVSVKTLKIKKQENKLILSTENLSGKTDVSIYNLSGIKVDSISASDISQEIAFDITNLERGCYLLKADNQSFKFTR